MKSLVVWLCVVTAVSAVSFTRVVYEEWKTYKLEHGKQYNSKLEDEYRMRIYAENKRKIARHNQWFALGFVTYSQKLNKYSDLTHREFVSVMNGYDGDRFNTAASNGQEETNEQYKPSGNWTIPATVDWRKKGAVTEVKNQEMCASCWAFSATGALEGQHYIRTHRLVSLSEQNLIDCSREYWNMGCKGGTMKNAFAYIKNNGGVDTESSYPYEALDDRCRYDPHNSGAKDSGFVAIAENEWTLMDAVAFAGPVSAAIHGSLESFRHYSAGVYVDNKCTARARRDHAVLIVGYGNDQNYGDYWLVKNSWGLSWGMDGYAKMARNRNNLCGIASEASYPRV